MNPRISFALAGIAILLLACACFADTQERVAPPEDAARLHLSVVGISNNADYQRVLSWFDNDRDLAELKRTLHFHAVKAGSEIYNARYKPNLSGLPTIRLQDGQGVVLYEVYGRDLPKSAEALADDIGRKTNQIFNRPLLPWRRQMEKQCDGCDNCGPSDVLTPEDLMEEEFAFDEPPLLPVEPEPQGLPVWVCVLVVLMAGGGGFAGAIIGAIKKEMAS
jgi:hypothetical protein